MPGVDTAREAGRKFLMQSQHMIAAAELEDIDGILVFNHTDDRNFQRGLPHRQYDVGVDRVAAVGKNQARLRHA